MKVDRRSRWPVLFTALILVTILVAGCGSGKKSTPTPTPAPIEPAVFRVAAVAPSAADDLAFSQSMYQALERVQTEMGADKFQFDFQPNTFVVDDAKIAIRQWAESGQYRLIIAHGSQYGDIIKELAPQFPAVSFAWGTDVNTFDMPNVFAYEAAAEEGGYVNGVLAASLTKSKTIGLIGPVEVGDAKLYTDGFVAGVAATDPSVDVKVTYTNSFTDVPLATQAAEADLEAGADILTGSSQMVVGPIATAIDKGNVLWFGTQSNQAEVSQNAGVAFQVYHWEVILTDMINQINAGTLGGSSFSLNLANGGLVIEYNDAYTLPDDLVTLANDTIQGIVDGKITVLPAQ
jgi:basic membrane lipoprotein Med (substrate-binding protein (PBP1-ABC) superfamily)